MNVSCWFQNEKALFIVFRFGICRKKEDYFSVWFPEVLAIAIFRTGEIKQTHKALIMSFSC